MAVIGIISSKTIDLIIFSYLIAVPLEDDIENVATQLVDNADDDNAAAVPEGTIDGADIEDTVRGKHRHYALCGYLLCCYFLSV